MPCQNLPAVSSMGVPVLPWVIKLSEGDVYQASSFQGTAVWIHKKARVRYTKTIAKAIRKWRFAGRNREVDKCLSSIVSKRVHLSLREMIWLRVRFSAS